MAKPALGFRTKKDLKEAIRQIVDRYGLEEEFFDPLVQRLFVERPAHCEPPGPTYTKFKWTKHTLPNGATTERWFMAYLDGKGWKGASLNKCIDGKRFTPDDYLSEFARRKSTVFTSNHRDKFPLCQYDGCMEIADDVHHVVPMRQIIEDALLTLSQTEKDECIEKYYDFMSREMFIIPDDHKFTQYIIESHGPGSMMSLCKDHHYAVEGKKRRKDPCT